MPSLAPLWPDHYENLIEWSIYDGNHPAKDSRRYLKPFGLKIAKSREKVWAGKICYPGSQL